ncbi:MAG: hypothetical protein HY959_01490 [Ignavibacteriae bacterium]|nr:hypothetical protein [Ignavibacteriota bacterium]
MKRKITVFSIIIFTAFSISGFSQDSGNSGNFRFFDKPFIELNNGVSKLSLDGYNGSFSNAGIIEVKLGSATQFKSRYSKDVLKYFNSYLFLSKASETYNYKSKTAGTQPYNMWRFGTGKKEGYGAKIGSMSVVPYTSNSLAWTYLDLNNFTELTTQSDINALTKFNRDIRFGTQSEGGIILNVLPMLSLEAKYERSAIFPRTLFWKYAGSAIIEEGGMQILDNFVARILKNKPLAGAIVNFVLKNAYSYGMYELRKTKMNWPFDTEAPLMHESFKFGIGFTF